MTENYCGQRGQILFIPHLSLNIMSGNVGAANGTTHIRKSLFLSAQERNVLPAKEALRSITGVAPCCPILYFAPIISYELIHKKTPPLPFIQTPPILLLSFLTYSLHVLLKIRARFF